MLVLAFYCMPHENLGLVWLGKFITNCSPLSRKSSSLCREERRNLGNDGRGIELSQNGDIEIINGVGEIENRRMTLVYVRFLIPYRGCRTELIVRCLAL
jgi:hypothetical protein